MSYAILCPCGKQLQGLRQPHHQVVVCPACRRSQFVLPRSPYDQQASIQRNRPVGGWRRWRLPILAALGCLASVLALFALSLPYLSRSIEESEPPPSAAELLDEVSQIRKAIGQGNLHTARARLAVLIDQLPHCPELNTPEQVLPIHQLHRQVDLLARLSPASLEDIARHAALVRDPAEWRAQFSDYRGRSFLFDDRLRRDNNGQIVLVSHVFEVDDEIIRPRFDEVTLLRELPLDEEPRLLFGVRIKACVREANGWAIHFEPESGVLITDAVVAEFCLPLVPADQLAPVLQRQQRWLQQRGVVAPALP